MPIKCENGQIILDEEELGDDYEPTEEEIEAYARDILGIDPETEPDLMHFAKEGICASLPEGWKACQDTNDEVYYFNFKNGESSWDHPADKYFCGLVEKERIRMKSKKTKTKTQESDPKQAAAARVNTKSPMFGRTPSEKTSRQEGTETMAPDTEVSLGASTNQFHREANEGFDEDDKSGVSTSGGSRGGGGSSGGGGYKKPITPTGVEDLRNDAASVGSEEEQSDESEEVEFGGDPNLSDKLLQSTNRASLDVIGYSPEASLTASLVSPPKTPRSSVTRSPRKMIGIMHSASEPTGLNEHLLKNSSVGGTRRDLQSSGLDFSELNNMTKEVNSNLPKDEQMLEQQIRELNEKRLRELRNSFEDEKHKLRQSHDQDLKQMRDGLRMEKQKIHDEHVKSLAELQQQVKKMNNEQKQMEEEDARNKLLDEIKDQFPDIVEERNRIVKQNQQKLATLRKQLEEELNEEENSLRAKHKTDIESIQNHFNTLKQDEQTAFENELKIAKKNYEDDLEKERRKLARDLEAAISNIKLENSKKLSSVQNQIYQDEEAKIGEEKTRLDRELKSLNEDHERILTSKKASLAAQLRDIERKHEKEMSETEMKCSKELNELLARQKKEAEIKQNDLRATLRSQENELMQVTEELERAKQQVDEELAQIEKQKSLRVAGETQIVSSESGQLPAAARNNNDGGLLQKSDKAVETDPSFFTTGWPSRAKKTDATINENIIIHPNQDHGLQSLNDDPIGGDRGEDEDDMVPIGRVLDQLTNQGPATSIGEEEEKKAGGTVWNDDLDEDDTSSGFSSTENLIAALNGRTQGSGEFGGPLGNSTQKSDTNKRLVTLMKSLKNGPYDQPTDDQVMKGASRSSGRFKMKLGAAECAEIDGQVYAQTETVEQMMERKWRTYFGRPAQPSSWSKPNRNPHYSNCSNEQGWQPVGYGYVPASDLLKRFRHDMTKDYPSSGLMPPSSLDNNWVQHQHVPHGNKWMPPSGSVESQLQNLNKWLTQFRETMITDDAIAPTPFISSTAATRAPSIS